MKAQRNSVQCTRLPPLTSAQSPPGRSDMTASASLCKTYLAGLAGLATSSRGFHLCCALQVDCLVFFHMVSSRDILLFFFSSEHMRTSWWICRLVWKQKIEILSADLRHLGSWASWPIKFNSVWLRLVQRVNLGKDLDRRECQRN